MTAENVSALGQSEPLAAFDTVAAIIALIANPEASAARLKELRATIEAAATAQKELAEARQKFEQETATARAELEQERATLRERAIRVHEGERQLEAAREQFKTNCAEEIKQAAAYRRQFDVGISLDRSDPVARAEGLARLDRERDRPMMDEAFLRNFSGQSEGEFEAAERRIAEVEEGFVLDPPPGVTITQEPAKASRRGARPRA